jgi:hypothetical protein
VTVCIFTGPTLSPVEGRQLLDAIYLPPAAHGDIYRATLRRPQPRVIGLIDGYFRSVPAVRHKEILWAMAQGIHVFGAASIGALRAADLAAYGMVGVGAIFDDFHAGRLEDDDEVAVDHGPADLGYLAVSEAMVDIRSTMASALRQGIVSARLHEAVVAAAKQRHYPDRSYRTVLHKVAGQDSGGAEIDMLRRWLPLGRVTQKRDDAIAMLTAMRDFLATNPPPLQVGYHFERTEAWETDKAFAAPAGVVGDTQGIELRREDLLDELRLRPELYRDVRRAALARALALREASRQGIEVGDDDIAVTAQIWAAERHLHTQRDLDDWRAANGLNEAEFRSFIAEEARQRRLAEMAEPIIEDRLLDSMREQGCLAELMTRAFEKQRTLAARGSIEGTLAGAGITPFELVVWFVSQKLRRPPPVDMHNFATLLGFSDLAAFHRAVLREYYYEQENGRQPNKRV